MERTVFGHGMESEIFDTGIPMEFRLIEKFPRKSSPDHIEYIFFERPPQAITVRRRQKPGVPQQLHVPGFEFESER
uniref:Uncharacterized protein n=1 Tax=Caenorhabditis japonica TaxID=281687 RepID=A0A8R1E8L4_CAEJA